MLGAGASGNGCSVIVGHNALGGLGGCLGLSHGMLVIASDNIPGRCSGTITERSATPFIFAFARNRRDGGFSACGTVLRGVVGDNFAEDSYIITINNNIINSVTKFTTTSFVHKVSFCGVPAAILSRISSSINNGITVSFYNIGGVMNTFCPPGTIVVSTSALDALPSHRVSGKLYRTLGVTTAFSRDLFGQFRGSGVSVGCVVRGDVGVGHGIIRGSRGRRKLHEILGFNRAVNRTVRDRGLGSLCRNRYITLNVLCLYDSRTGTEVGGTLVGLGLPASVDISTSGVVRLVSRSGGGSKSDISII